MKTETAKPENNRGELLELFSGGNEQLINEELNIEGEFEVVRGAIISLSEKAPVIEPNGQFETAAKDLDRTLAFIRQQISDLKTDISTTEELVKDYLGIGEPSEEIPLSA